MKRANYYTPKERLDMYKMALKGLRGQVLFKDATDIGWQKWDAGVCELLQHTLPVKNPWRSHCSEIRDRFPEFMLFQPDNPNVLFWWDSRDRTVRETCLEFCIQMVKDKIKK